MSSLYFVFSNTVSQKSLDPIYRVTYFLDIQYIISSSSYSAVVTNRNHDLGWYKIKSSTYISREKIESSKLQCNLLPRLLTPSCSQSSFEPGLRTRAGFTRIRPLSKKDPDRYRIQSVIQIPFIVGAGSGFKSTSIWIRLSIIFVLSSSDLDPDLNLRQR